MHLLTTKLYVEIFFCKGSIVLFYRLNLKFVFESWILFFFPSEAVNCLITLLFYILKTHLVAAR